VAVRVHVLGCGDAFGSGGRAQTCVAIEASGRRVLVDCGADALVSMRRSGIAPETIEAVAVTHLHGDHFGGLPFLVLHARHVARHPQGVHVAGPRGVQARAVAALDALYEGAGHLLAAPPGSEPLVRFEEYTAGVPFALGAARATALPVAHSGTLACHGIRLELEGRVIAYSGDTSWTDTLLDLARGADVFIVECQAWDTPPPGHMGFDDLRRHLPALDARRVLLTHMGEPMLARAAEAIDDRVLAARDGLVMEL
jgi:ribonuclease BN (tRNA processing enzyme)